MNRVTSGLAATGGLLALALAVTPALPALAAGPGPDPVARESNTLKVTEQSRADASAKALGTGSSWRRRSPA